MNAKNLFFSYLFSTIFLLGCTSEDSIEIESLSKKNDRSQISKQIKSSIITSGGSKKLSEFFGDLVLGNLEGKMYDTKSILKELDNLNQKTFFDERASAPCPNSTGTGSPFPSNVGWTQRQVVYGDLQLNFDYGANNFYFFRFGHTIILTSTGPSHENFTLEPFALNTFPRNSTDIPGSECIKSAGFTLGYNNVTILSHEKFEKLSTYVLQDNNDYRYAAYRVANYSNNVFFFPIFSTEHKAAVGFE